VVRLALVLLVVAACSKDGGGAASGSGSAGSAAAGSAARAEKKGAGFSASLSAELAKEGSGSATAAGSATGSDVAAAGSAAKTGSAAAPAMGSAMTPAAGSAAVATAAGSAAVPAAGSAAPKGPAVADTRPVETKPVAVERPSASRVPVKPSPEQAAIKLDLEPNWDRDVGEAGTISFVLKVPNTGDTRLFSFRYGYDPDSAPADRDAYMKWLADQKILNVTLNRQRGAAWYLEGTDGSAPAFRYLVNYGGKHLICYGSLYKDAASNQLGDLRDKVVMAAKKICETMTL
jgi:hypothetical protein